MEPMLLKIRVSTKSCSSFRRHGVFEGYTHAPRLRIAAIADAIGKELQPEPRTTVLMQQAALIPDLGELVMNRDYI